MTEQASRETIIDFADKYLGEYRIRGEEITPKFCPICHGGSSGKDTYTFALSLDKAVYVCKRGSCGRHGRFEELAKEISGEEIHISRKFSTQEQKKSFILPDTVVSPPTEQIYKYFESRGISKQTVDDFKIGSDPEGMIVFRFYENGTNVYEKYRRPWKPNDDEKKRKEWQFSGAKPILYNMDNVVFTRPLVITEGQIDCMALHEAGITNVVSVPSGCSNMDWVKLCWDWLEKFRAIILFGDNDEPGRQMVAELTKRLGEERVRVVKNYPEIKGTGPEKRYCKDANEILLRNGPFELIDMVDGAEEIPVRGLLDLSEVKPIDPTVIPRVKTNIADLDMCLGGLQEGSITIVTGKTGAGKSTLSGLMMLNAIEQGWTVCAYSGELPKEKFQEWINMQAAGSDWIGLKYDRIRSKNVPFVSLEVQNRIMEWYKGKFFLFDNNEIFEEKKQAEAIIDIFVVAARKYNAKLFVVDNMMSSLSDTDEELRAQTRFINALKKFATKYKVHVICVSHPRKTKIDVPLDVFDVAGSANIVNLADSAIVVERPDIRIIKNRDGGIQKTIEGCYCADSRRIYQADKGDENKFSWDRTGLRKPSPRADSMEEYGIQLSQTTKAPF